MNENDNLVIDKYMITAKIGKGSFGDVYKATRITDEIDIAMKIEKRKGSMSRLIPEYKIYKKLYERGCKKGIPRIYEILQSDDYNMLILELLGESLEDLFVKYSQCFSVSTVVYLGVEILQIIERIHNAGFIHRDIKPNNFLIGFFDKKQIYLTDFGLSKEYITENGSHIKETFDRSIIGTARYSSIHMHMGFEPSRRDDLESIGYMLIYFAKGKLPWQGANKHKDKNDMFNKIMDIKLSTKLETLCQNLPKCFIHYLQYCWSLKFNEKPNYQYLIKLFQETIKQNNFKCQYEWMT